MKIHIIPSLAESVGKLWQNLQNEKTTSENFYIAAPLSNTPLPIYDWIIQHANELRSWDKTKFVLMDEMIEGVPSEMKYVSREDPVSYESFAKGHFIYPLKEKIGIEVEIIKPNLSEISIFKTPIDLLILALGIDGNYANVMQGTNEKSGWHIAYVTDAYRQIHTSANGAYAGSKFGSYGMSLGPQQVLQAGEVIVIVSGEHKHDLVKKLLSYDHFDPQFPLSIIYMPEVKDRVTVYITEDVGISTA